VETDRFEVSLQTTHTKKATHKQKHKIKAKNVDYCIPCIWRRWMARFGLFWL